MKKIFVLLMAFVCAHISHAQDTKKVFGSLTMVWSGLDFTKARMVGWSGESPHKIRDEYFKEWNVSVTADLGQTFQKRSVFRDSGPTMKGNSERETENLMSNDEAELSQDDIAAVVKRLPPGQKKEGLGVVLVVQSFNKTTNMATVWVTFYDIATHEVLWSKKVSGKASSGNALTAWKGAISDIINKIGKTEYSAWKKEANY